MIRVGRKAMIIFFEWIVTWYEIIEPLWREFGSVPDIHAFYYGDGNEVCGGFVGEYLSQKTGMLEKGIIGASMVYDDLKEGQ